MNTVPTFNYDISTTVQTVAALAGNNIVTAITSSLPYVLPILAVLWGIRYALAKIGLN